MYFVLLYVYDIENKKCFVHLNASMAKMNDMLDFPALYKLFGIEIVRSKMRERYSGNAVRVKKDITVVIFYIKYLQALLEDV